MKKDKLVINIPPGSFFVSLAVGIVYNWKLGLAAFVMLVLLGTILEKINERS